MSDYIPTQDAPLGAYLTNAAVLATATPAQYGLAVGDATALTEQAGLWDAAYLPLTSPTTKTPAAVANKNAVRASVLETVRPILQKCAQNPTVSPEDKTALGVTVRKTVPTPTPPPSTQPTLTLLGNTPGVIAFGYADASTPTTKAKPFGAIGVQLWRAVGVEYATDPSQTSYVGTFTKSPGRLLLDAADAGKKCTIFARWVTRAGPGGVAQVGPWSDRVTTIVV